MNVKESSPKRQSHKSPKKVKEVKKEIIKMEIPVGIDENMK